VSFDFGCKFLVGAIHFALEKGVRKGKVPTCRVHGGCLGWL